MRKLFLSILLLAGLGACQQNPGPAATAATDQINPVAGNASYVAAFGQEPTAADEDTRIRTHLAYAEQVLRQRATQGMAAEQLARRKRTLDLLHRYWTAGVFPRNYDHPEARKPCFIDRDGRLCAVGYLVAQTAGRPLAERINREHQYDYIADMRTPELGAWVATSGLTKAECALIQPTYGNPVVLRQEVPVAAAYAVPSAVWSGLNGAFAVVNATRIGQATPSPQTAWLGLISGGGQALLGALNLPKDSEPGYTIGWGPQEVKTYGSERAVSYMNIGVGTATLALSAWNLLSHRPGQEAPRTTVGVMSYPAGPDPSGAGLALTRRF